MGRLFVEMMNNNVVITRYESDGLVIPDNISQRREVVAIINSNLDTDSNTTTVVGDMALSREDFISYLLSQGKDYQDRYVEFGRGLYSMKDIKKGITWSEVAYLLHYVGNIPKSLDWNSISPRKQDRVCVLHELDGASRRLDVKLAHYKNRLDMENYIRAIVGGNRYIPLPLYCSFVDLCENNVLGQAELNLDMMFKKVSEQEFGLIEELLEVCTM